MSSLLGLAGYQGDSEISDSEGESSPGTDTRPQPPGVVSSGLGIPRSAVQQEVPATEPFVPPVVQSAPSIGLVDYYHDDDEGLGEEEEGEDMDTGVLLIPQHHKVATQGSSSPAAITISGTRQQLETVSDTELSLGEEDRAESPDVTTGEGLFLPLTDITLPPPPQAECSPELQRKIAEMLRKKAQGKVDYNKLILKRKDVRNPSIYKSLVDFCDLNEFGSNYPTSVYDPQEWSEESYYDQLAIAQRKQYEKRERAKADRTKVEFVSSTKQSSSSASDAQADKKRRSKWDVATGTSGSGSHTSSPSHTTKDPSGVGAQALVNANLINKEMLRLLPRK